MIGINGISWMFKGLLTNIKFFFISITCAIICSYKLSIFLYQNKSIYANIIQAIFDFMRSVTVLAQLLFIVFGCGYICRYFGLYINSSIWCYVLLILNSIAYSSQIFINGMSSISVYKIHLLKQLGYTKYQSYSKILFYEIFHKTYRPLFNESITIFKETSLIGQVGIEEIVQISNRLSGISLDFLSINLCLCLILYCTAKLYKYIFPYHLTLIKYIIQKI